MRNILAAGAVVALFSTAAVAAEAPKPPVPPTVDQMVEQTQMRLYAAQADYNMAVARKFQAEAVEGAKREAAKDAWWASWWKATYPETPAPAAVAAPETPPAK